MLKENKWKILITSLIILVPMLVGAILWSQLPDTVATHFGVNNDANGWSSKPFAVFGMPSFMLVLHLLCLVVTSVDPKYRNIGKKPIEIVFWIVPCLSLLVGALTYAVALGVSVDVGMIVCLFMGVLFIVLGNIMPKARQNYTFGLKLPWTLDDTENWNRTHRLAGWCYVIAGVLVIATSFLHKVWILLVVLIPTLLIPMVYSYVYYRRHGQKQ